MRLRDALIVSGALVVAALLHGGVYTIVGSGGGGDDAPGYGAGAYVVNRYTGSVVACIGKGCDRAWPE